MAELNKLRSAIEHRWELDKGRHADPRYEPNARGRDGGVREKLAAAVFLRSGGPLSNRKTFVHPEPFRF